MDAEHPPPSPRHSFPSLPPRPLLFDPSDPLLHPFRLPFDPPPPFPFHFDHLPPPPHLLPHPFGQPHLLPLQQHPQQLRQPFGQLQSLPPQPPPIGHLHHHPPPPPLPQTPHPQPFELPPQNGQQLLPIGQHHQLPVHSIGQQPFHPGPGIQQTGRETSQPQQQGELLRYTQPLLSMHKVHELPGPQTGRVAGSSREKEPVTAQESGSSGATVSDNEYSSNSARELVEAVADEDEVLMNCCEGSQSLAEASHLIGSYTHVKAKQNLLGTSTTPRVNQVPMHSVSPNDAAQALQPNSSLVDQPLKASTSGSQETTVKKKKKKLKQVQFQLDPLAHQKLMKLVSEQHEGSFERFVIATVNANVMQEKPGKKTVIRKPAISKWKRTRFDQLKGNETEELALAFRSLADSTAGAEVTPELIETPWQELNMAQIEKMLEETKKMLLLNEKVHDCPHPDCSRRFSTPGNLRDHLNEHSGEQPYSCNFEDCPHRFRSKQLLCRHLKKHERAHRCTFEGCNKRFAFRERLIVHQKTHSDERPLTCPWEGCGKTFKWANSLHGHMRTHTGEKPFQCTFAGCGRLFGYKVDLTRHRRTHFGQPARSSH